jgi:glucose-1-phosphate thymidylyltransferase
MSKIEKAVILARGLGTRMRAETANSNLSFAQAEIAAAGIKTLIPIVGKKTLLDFIFESLTAAGFTKICLIIGEEHQAIRDFCADKPYDISFAVQAQPLGTANAVLAAEDFVKDDLFLSVNSDNLYPVNSLKKLRKAGHQGLIAFERHSLIEKSNIPPDRIAKFAVIELDENNFLQRITEKPETVAENSFVSMNAWLFSSLIFEACRQIKLSARGEYELADSVMLTIEKLGGKFKAIKSSEGVLDLSNRADVAQVARKLITKHTVN